MKEGRIGLGLSETNPNSKVQLCRLKEAAASFACSPVQISPVSSFPIAGSQSPVAIVVVPRRSLVDLGKLALRPPSPSRVASDETAAPLLHPPLLPSSAPISAALPCTVPFSH
ncbi:unnamed protein product [Linum trigynum]|uniref:Uncharacterized protein n=1 Tax=Linum trigynum TaxID=586398 RepID=A0AAV2E5T3_9ROSI